MSLKPGDVFEAAVWADGRETEKQLAQYKTDLKAQLAYYAEQEGVILGPLSIIEKRPGEDRVPPVPDEISGPNVRLLVGEVKVIDDAPQFEIHSSRFVDELEHDDLRRLRMITRTAYKRHFPYRPPLTDFECDNIIDNLGPDAALDALNVGQFGVSKLH